VRRAALVLGLVMLVGPAAAVAADQHAVTACQLAGTVDDSGGQDLTTLRALVQQVSNAAAQSVEPQMRRSATMLGRSARQPSPAGILSALRAFRETCRRAVTPPSAKSHQVPEAEFDRQLHDVLERSGRRGASCEKEQFGEGWVAVCE